MYNIRLYGYSRRMCT